MDELLDSLNEEQIKPVLDTEGPVLVFAGAGSGKTRVLTTRMAYILRCGKAKMSEILAITFTNKAAGEMKERMEKLLDRPFDRDESKWICTIHSMCVKILREFYEEAGVKQNFTIYTDNDRTALLRKIVKERDLEKGFEKKVAPHIDKAKSQGLDPDEYGEACPYFQDMEDVLDVYAEYERRLRHNNALDFDDLLLYTRAMLRRDEDAREFLSERFKYILVDEFQDTNVVQYDIIKLLVNRKENFFAVGDDDQSIYGWRGSEVKHILNFSDDFPDAKVYKLERNYRSTKNILSFANRIISKNEDRQKKTLWTDAEDGPAPAFYRAEDERDEAAYAVRIIWDGVGEGARYSDFAVLMRMNALTRSFEQELQRYGIPYKVTGGYKFFERKEVKEVMAYFNLVTNTFDDEAFERVVNVPKRGIGAKTLEIVRSYARKRGLSMYEAALEAKSIKKITAAAQNRLYDFAALIRDLVYESMTESLSEIARNIIDKTDIVSAYMDGTDEGDNRLANINGLVASVDEYAKQYRDASLADFMTQTSLRSDSDDLGGDAVQLATIHAAKGLEFENVFICGLEEGLFPSSRAIDEGAGDEERRLMYVAITRAKHRLYLTCSRERFLYGRTVSEAPSVFWNELKGEPSRPRESSGSSNPSGSSEKFASNFYRRETEQRSAPEGGYRVGMKVSHPRFGDGMVVALKQEGKTVSVAFDGKGIVDLSAALAPLTIL